MEPVYVPGKPREKAMQRALIQYRDPKNHRLVLEALREAGRMDLVGYGGKCLIPPRVGNNLEEDRRAARSSQKRTGEDGRKSQGREKEGQAGRKSQNREKERQAGRKSQNRGKEGQAGRREKAEERAGEKDVRKLEGRKKGGKGKAG